MKMRTDLCGELRLEDAGRQVALCGWVARRREHGEHLAFVDLRDHTGVIQCVVDGAHDLRSEYVVRVTGTVRPRPEGTANPDLAAEYLDWMISPRAAQLWAEARIIPAMPLPEGTNLEEGTLFADTVSAWNRINEDNGVGHYIDWASPTMYDTLVAELQKVFGQEEDPAAFTAAVEKDYSGFLETMQ